MKYLFHKNTLLIVIGNFLLAFSVCAFTLPFNITVGGTTGISIICNNLFQFNLSELY